MSTPEQEPGDPGQKPRAPPARRRRKATRPRKRIGLGAETYPSGGNDPETFATREIHGSGKKGGGGGGDGGGDLPGDGLRPGPSFLPDSGEGETRQNNPNPGGDLSRGDQDQIWRKKGAAEKPGINPRNCMYTFARGKSQRAPRRSAEWRSRHRAPPARNTALSWLPSPLLSPPPRTSPASFGRGGGGGEMRTDGGGSRLRGGVGGGGRKGEEDDAWELPPPPL